MSSRILNYLQYLWESYDKIPMFIELFMIGFVVYSVMRFLQGTGGAKLLKGVFLLVLGVWTVSVVMRWASIDLERISWLFRYFFAGLLIVAALAFQPELRRGLMRLGGTHLGVASVPETVHAIEQIVDAVSTFSRRKIGAIIAMEREVGLIDVMTSGTKLDANVTTELLYTIFWPGTPLHDMGVVIQQGRLAAAGVQFPLAEYGEYDRSLGSRHRAAIGLSKETDAVVVVVSEETGTIGIAVDGKLARFLTIEQLRQQLLDLMIPRTDSRTDTAAKPQAVATDEKPKPQHDTGTQHTHGKQTSGKQADTKTTAVKAEPEVRP